MSSILIEKIRNALETDEPIVNIKEIVSEYDELERLAKWRIAILKCGKTLKRDKDKIDEVEDRLREAGYYMDIDVDNQVKEYFSNLNKRK